MHPRRKPALGGIVAQLFHPYADTAVRIVLFALAASPALLIGAGFAITRSPYVTGQEVVHTQPVPFSHEHHVGFDGLDCRYCHFGVETSRWAGIPPTEVCMTCHSQLFAQASVLAPVRESLALKKPIAWNWVHALPDYVYFDHSIHVAKGVGCTTCHGQVDQMPLMKEAQSMTMGWCLDCHRNPGPKSSQARRGVRDRLDTSAQPERRGPSAHGALPHRHRALDRLFSMPSVSRFPPIDQLPLSRRAALQMIVGGVASLAAGCNEPDEKIVAQDTATELPYVHLPEGLLPGIAKHYATTLPLGGYGRGAIVTAFEGRPTKVEGNARHPASLGGTDVFAQAEILGLYDPDRSQTVRLAGEIADWPAFESAFRSQMGGHAADKGAGLRLLSGRITSPTLLDQIAGLKARYPDLRWHQFEPAENDDTEPARAVYGEPLTLRPRLMDAAVVVAFGADPLGAGPEQAANARALASRRGSAVQLYSAECVMTLTGAFADKRISAHPDAIEAMIGALASRLGASLSAPNLQEHEERFVVMVAKALQARAGGGLVLAGSSLSPMARALAVWINDRLAGPVDTFAASHSDSEAGTLAELATDLQGGRFRHFLSSIRIPSQRRRAILTLRL